MTQIAYFGNYAFPVDAPRRWFHPSGYGTLGFALPAAIGAKIASPAHAVAALAGDFGLQFTLAELMTAVEANLSLPMIGVEQFGPGSDPRRHDRLGHPSHRCGGPQSGLRGAGSGVRRGCGARERCFPLDRGSA